MVFWFLPVPLALGHGLLAPLLVRSSAFPHGIRPQVVVVHSLTQAQLAAAVAVPLCVAAAMVLAFIMILAHVRKQAPSLQPPAAQTTSPAANAPELGSKAAPGVGPDTTLVITDVQVGRV